MNKKNPSASLRAGAAADTAERELVLSRVLDAPRGRVWAALSDIRQIEQWWGPDGFMTRTERFEFKPGGTWRQVMVGPDGAEYPNQSRFDEIVPMERISYTHGGGAKGEKGTHFKMVWSLKDLPGGRTELTLRQIYDTVEDREHVVKRYGALEGGKQTLARLNEHLTKSGDFVIRRLLDAPREKVWRAWTEPERMAKWFGPKGLSTVASKLELKPGGLYHYGMKTPDGHEMWGKWVFREIRPPERLVFVSSFSDKDGGLTRHPLSKDWPLETLSTVTFEEQGSRTLLTIKWAAINANETEKKVFESSHESMNKGWGGTLEQLEAFLKEDR